MLCSTVVAIIVIAFEVWKKIRKLKKTGCYRLQIPVCGDESFSQEVPLEGLMGLQGSSGDTGDDSFLMKAFLAAATPCILLLPIFVAGTGTFVQRFIKDFGDSKGEGSSLLSGREETVAVEGLIWKVLDDWERGLDGLEDKMGLWGDLAGDLGESGGVGEITDCGLGDDEGE